LSCGPFSGTYLFGIYATNNPQLTEKLFQESHRVVMVHHRVADVLRTIDGRVPLNVWR
jgi:hypothetical protein